MASSSSDTPGSLARSKGTVGIVMGKPGTFRHEQLLSAAAGRQSRSFLFHSTPAYVYPMMQCVIVALSYALLAEEACRGSQVGLPRTALLRHYPCGATAWQRMSYIALLQLPVALLLPAKWFHRIAFLLSYSIRTSPLIAHFVMHATKGPTGVPGPTGRWYIMSAMWSCDLFNFLAIPEPHPLPEAMYGITSVAVLAWLLPWFGRAFPELGAPRHVYRILLRQAVVVCFTTYLAWIAARGRARQQQQQQQQDQGRHQSQHEYSADGAAAGCSDLETEKEAATELWKQNAAAAAAAGAAGSGISASARAAAPPVPGHNSSNSNEAHPDACSGQAAQRNDPSPVGAQTRSQPAATNACPSQTAVRTARYQGFVKHQTVWYKIPGVHLEQLPPDYVQRLTHLVEDHWAAGSGGGGSGDGGVGGGGGGASGGGGSGRSRWLHAVYVRSGCIELVLEYEQLPAGGGATCVTGAAAARSSACGQVHWEAHPGSILTAGRDASAAGLSAEVVLKALGLHDSFLAGLGHASAGAGGSGVPSEDPPADAVPVLPAAHGATRVCVSPRVLLLPPAVGDPGEAPRSVLHLEVEDAAPEGEAGGTCEAGEQPGCDAGGMPGEPEVCVRCCGRRVGATVTAAAAAAEEEEGEEEAEAGDADDGSYDGSSRGSGGSGGTVRRYTVEVLEQLEGPGVATVEVRWGGLTCFELPLLLTHHPGIAEEVGAAAAADPGLWGGCPASLDPLLMDLGAWERSRAVGGGGQQGGQVLRGVGYMEQLTEHLLRFAEECGWERTAGVLRGAGSEHGGVGGGGGRQEEQEQEKQQRHARSCKGASAARGHCLAGEVTENRVHADAVGKQADVRASHDDSKDGSSCDASGSYSSGSGGGDATAECGGCTGSGGGGSGGGASGSCGRGVAWGNKDECCGGTASGGGRGVGRAAVHGSLPESGGYLEQAYLTLEAVSFLLLLRRGYRNRAQSGLLAEVTSLAMGPGALLLLARAFMTRGSWARLLAAYRLPRAVLYVAAKAAVAAARGRLRVLDAAFLRGPGHALLEGVLMPLCCPLPTRASVLLLLANSVALAGAVWALELPRSGALGTAVAAGVREALVGLATAAVASGHVARHVSDTWQRVTARGRSGSAGGGRGVQGGVEVAVAVQEQQQQQ